MVSIDVSSGDMNQVEGRSRIDQLGSIGSISDVVAKSFHDDNASSNEVIYTQS